MLPIMTTRRVNQRVHWTPEPPFAIHIPARAFLRKFPRETELLLRLGAAGNAIVVGSPESENSARECCAPSGCSAGLAVAAGYLYKLKKAFDRDYKDDLG